MSDELDRADIARVVEGDTEAFAGIVGRWQTPLVSLAYRYCRDRDQAEDMAQAAFVAAYRAAAQWRGETKFSSWLFAVAANVYRSEMRRRFVSTVSIDASEPAQRSEQEIADPERAAVVRRLVATLPAKYRDVMVLFYFHDMNVDQAAASLGVPEGTVKARLHRARAILERELRTAMPPGELS